MKRGTRLAAIALALTMLGLPQPASAAGASIAAFRGIGAWIDIFDDAYQAAPEAAVADLKARGVETLFLQSATYRFKGPIRYPEATSRFLDAAHANGIKVVAWYVPGFDNLERDLAWSLAAVRFRSAGGQRFDALGLDIEATKVRNHDTRSARLVKLSRDLRNAVGAGYPLGAIIPSWIVPTASGGEIASGFWSNFPYAGIAPHYDVVLPMAYWTYRVKGRSGTEGLIRRSVQIIRERMGRRLAIHPIGGIANKSTRAEMKGFAEVVREARLIGASVYDTGTSGPEEWEVLAELKPHLRGKKKEKPKVKAPVKVVKAAPVILTLPAAPGRWTLDRTASRVAGGDRVAYRFPTGAAARLIRVRAFDVREGEVVMTLNGAVVGTLKPTAEKAWGEPQTIFSLRPEALGRITFDSLLNPPGTDPWGVQIIGTGAIGPI